MVHLKVVAIDVTASRPECPALVAARKLAGINRANRGSILYRWKILAHGFRSPAMPRLALIGLAVVLFAGCGVPVKPPPPTSPAPTKEVYDKVAPMPHAPGSKAMPKL